MSKDNIEQKQNLIDLMNMENKENIIDKWLKENGNPKIEKQVEKEYKEIMKETAVEYLIKVLPKVYWEDPYYSDLLEQAKEMEKQQLRQFRESEVINTNRFIRFSKALGVSDKDATELVINEIRNQWQKIT